MERVFTIGAYGFEADTFFAALQHAEIDLFLDIRRRRGVRGSAYAFANATRLIAELETCRIAYQHVIELAPDAATRGLQDREDTAGRIAKRKRETLGQAFVEAYSRDTLAQFDWGSLDAQLKRARRPVLFCVERLPAACHRHLVASSLTERTGVPVTHLMP